MMVVVVVSAVSLVLNGDRAAQYRYEVMQTLQGVRRQVAEIEEATRKLDRQDARILRDNKETFQDTLGKAQPRSQGDVGQGWAGCEGSSLPHHRT